MFSTKPQQIGKNMIHTEAAATALAAYVNESTKYRVIGKLVIQQQSISPEKFVLGIKHLVTH